MVAMETNIKILHIKMQVSNERIQTTIIPSCSQNIIDNENPDFVTLFFWKMQNETVWLLW
jgi:hypothetical protein